MSNNITEAIDNLNGVSGKSNNAVEAIDRLAVSFKDLKDKVAGTERDISWLEILNDVQSGDAGKYTIGDIIEDEDVSWRVVHKAEEELRDSTKVSGMWLQSRYCTDANVQFSQRAFYACPDGLEAGSYYITFGSTVNHTPIVKDEVLAFTLTKDVPAGGRLFIPDMYSAKVTWKVRVIDADGITVLEEVVPAFTATGTSLGTTNTNVQLRNENINGIYEMLYGYNNWAASAVRQYLNSDKPKGEWWQPYDKWDVAPNQLSTLDGYLFDKPSSFKAALREVKTVTYGNNTTDTDDIITYDKVIIPSLDQMFIAPQYSGDGEGEAFDYYKELRGNNTPFVKDQANPELVITNSAGAARYVLLRSPHRDRSYYEWYVFTTGNVYFNYAIITSSLQPIVFVG